MSRLPLGRLLLAVLLIAVCVALFLLIGSQVKSDSELVHFDRELGTSLQEKRKATLFLRNLFVAVTQIGAVRTFIVVVPLGAVLFWLRGQRAAALTLIACGLGAGLLNYGTKKHFDRPRPEFKDPLVRESNESFPSGHSSGSMAIFGFLIYLLTKTKLDRRSRFLAMAGLGLLIASIGFSRIYLGAHFFSDVMGGYLLGAAWLTLCITAMKTAPLLYEPGERGQ